MANPKPIAAGGPLAIIILVSAVIGVGLGASVAIALWLIDRDRKGE